MPREFKWTYWGF